MNTLEVPPIGCDKCDGYGNLITPQGAMECECKRRANTVMRLIAANIPPMYREKSLETFKTNTKAREKVFELAKKYIEDYTANQRGLLFWGKCGTGKSHLAVAILKALIHKGYTGLFYNTITLLDAIRATYDSSDESATWDLIDRVCDTDILVLDDLGAEKTSGWVNERLYAIVNKRYENRKTTIVTTNRDIPELKEQIGDRIYSRLVEMCFSIPFEGKDYRIEMMKSGEKLP
ncbi:MAG: ATP-binding protein [bacterium]|nr:ATP-binding protein [bacterium]